MMIDGFRVVRTANPTTIVVYCSDPDFQAKFHYLIEQKLGLDYGQYTPITVMGGGVVLAESVNQENERISVGEQIESALAEFRSIETVVLIGHEDCKRVRMSKDRAKECLLEAGETIRDLFRDVEVKLYFVGFDAIEEVLLSERQLA